jgi:hypothetical protein
LILHITSLPHLFCLQEKFCSISHKHKLLTITNAVFLLVSSFLHFSRTELGMCSLIYISLCEQVAEQLLIMHEECLQSNYSSIEKLRNSRVQGSAVSQSRQVVLFCTSLNLMFLRVDMYLVLSHSSVS